MGQKREDDRLRAEAIERKQAEVHARLLLERARLEECDKAKEKMQEVVLEARGVFGAKRERGAKAGGGPAQSLAD